MPIFEYQGLDPNGRVVSGEVYGASMEAAVSALTTKGFRVDHVTAPASETATPGRTLAAPDQPVYDYEKPANPYDTPPIASLGIPTERRSTFDTDIAGPLVGKVPLPDLSFFFRQLSAMLNAGVNPVESLDTLSNQTNSPKLRDVIREMSQYTLAARPMSEAMQRYPEVFTPVIMSLIRAGEQGGFLDEVLGQIADYLDREIALRNLIRRVTIYPKLVLGASIIIILGANAVIGAIAPQSTVRLSSPLTSPLTWLFLGPLLVGIFLFTRVGLQNPRVKYNWDQFLSRVPSIGTTSWQFAMAKFGRAFGSLYRAGVPIHEAFRLSADSCGNEYWRAKMHPAFRELESGASISETLTRTEAFTPIVMNMVSTGERTGNLDQTLVKMAEYYEGEAETRSIQMGWLTGVVALLCVGIYVGYLYISSIAGIATQSYQVTEWVRPILPGQ